MKSTLIEKHDLDRYLNIRELVKQYPNDMEFGSKVRELFWTNIDSCQHGNDLNSICSECDEEQMRDIWVCGICNKSTYDVDYDYIGTGTNHLGCELQIQSDNGAKINPNIVE
jgi:hypothetical protein